MSTFCTFLSLAVVGGSSVSWSESGFSVHGKIFREALARQLQKPLSGTESNFTANASSVQFDLCTAETDKGPNTCIRKDIPRILKGPAINGWSRHWNAFPFTKAKSRFVNVPEK